MGKSTTSLTTPARRVAAPPARTLGWYFNVVGLVAIHVGTVVAFVRGPTWSLALLALGTYLVRMFAITAVYHRYLAHRAFKTSRAMQLVLVALGTTAAQKGPLWWAGTHRHHHRFSDTGRDVHSPALQGFWYAHMGWWLGRRHERTDFEAIPDFAGYPELRWLDRNAVVGPIALGLATFLLGGLDAFLWGFVVSTCVLMHATFTINSLAHVFGSRRYATTDTSRNNLWLALLTLGEGWHNNHHHYMSSANQGFFWWEVDVSYYVLRLLEKVGLVWGLKRPPARVLRKNLLAEVGERCSLLVAATPPAPDALPLPRGERA